MILRSERPIEDDLTRRSSAARPLAIARWLLAVAGLVFVMVVVGGITRLTTRRACRNRTCPSDARISWTSAGSSSSRASRQTTAAGGRCFFGGVPGDSAIISLLGGWSAARNGPPTPEVGRCVAGPCGLTRFLERYDHEAQSTATPAGGRRLQFRIDAGRRFTDLELSIADRPEGSWRPPIVLTVALSIAATTLAFAVVEGVLLEPLPYATPERLVAVWEMNPRGNARNVVSPANYLTWKDELES